jgi:3-mercaptopyruvate sulfurtransferase SseA
MQTDMKRILICAVFLATACREGSNAPAAGATSAPSPPTQAPAASAQPPAAGAEALVPRVTSAELQKMIQSGDAVIIDVRAADNYTSAHIPGALHIPLSFIDQEAAYLPRGKRIVTYCT